MSFGSQQSLTARKTKNPWILSVLVFIVALAIVLAGLFFAYQANRKENVAVWARDIAAGQQITATDMQYVAMPVERPVNVAMIPDSTMVIGMWTTRNVGKDELVTPAQLQRSAPTVPFYPNGEQLPTGYVALPFSLKTVGPVGDNDKVNVNFVDTSGDPDRCAAMGGMPLAATTPVSTTNQPETATNTTTMSSGAIQMDAAGQPLPTACRLIPQADILYVNQEQQVAYLAVTPYQSQVIYLLGASANTTLYGERYGSTSPALPYLTKLQPQDINGNLLTGSVSDTLPLLPGIHAVLPGDTTRGSK